MRALTDLERRHRRDTLSDHAADLVAEVGYPRLTIEAVARRAGVAKGSVFLAFASKEDLVLHLVARRVELWFRRLDAVPPTGEPTAIAQGILATLRADPLLLPLLALVGPVLEQGCPVASVLGFKEGLAAHMGQLADRWSRAMPGVSVDRWLRLFLGVYAVTVGAWVVGETSADVAGALADRPDLQWLLSRFDELFVTLVAAQWATLAPEGGQA